MLAIDQIIQYCINAFHNRRLGRHIGEHLDDVLGGVHSVSFTVGAEATNVITVNCQAKDERGVDVAQVSAIKLYVLADAAGAAFNTTNYTTIAAGTDGALIETVADKILECLTEPDGDLDVAITLSSGGATCYLAAVGPTGKIIGVSDAITHAA